MDCGEAHAGTSANKVIMLINFKARIFVGILGQVYNFRMIRQHQCFLSFDSPRRLS